VLRHAINVVAQQAIYAATREDVGTGVEWGMYPEIGEDDWKRVLRQIDRATPPPTRGEYDAAYELLTSRADPTAEPNP